MTKPPLHKVIVSRIAQIIKTTEEMKKKYAALIEITGDQAETYFYLSVVGAEGRVTVLLGILE